MDDDVNEYRDGNVMVTEDMLRQAIIATDPHRLTATVSQLATYIRANSVIDVRVTEARLRTHIKLTLKRMSESGGLQRAPATYSLTSWRICEIASHAFTAFIGLQLLLVVQV